ncbi:uncharacterized protein V1518DRAFT_420097 [Limtongia smithiae]|uniref:uncharacterized protein n=1 Tax=Limtongia smithiae TaxID=1125753 RepID=UPI0034CF5411
MTKTPAARHPRDVVNLSSSDDDSRPVASPSSPVYSARRATKLAVGGRAPVVNMMDFLIPVGLGGARSQRQQSGSATKREKSATKEVAAVKVTTTPAVVELPRRMLWDGDEAGDAGYADENERTVRDVSAHAVPESMVVLEMPSSLPAEAEERDRHGDEHRDADKTKVGAPTDDTAPPVIEEFNSSILLRRNTPSSSFAVPSSSVSSPTPSSETLPRWPAHAPRNFKKFRKARAGAEYDKENETPAPRASKYAKMVEFKTQDYGLGDVYWSAPRDASSSKRNWTAEDHDKERGTRLNGADVVTDTRDNDDDRDETLRFSMPLARTTTSTSKQATTSRIATRTHSYATTAAADAHRVMRMSDIASTYDINNDNSATTGNGGGGVFADVGESDSSADDYGDGLQFRFGT